jgi:hypothetical protein
LITFRCTQKTRDLLGLSDRDLSGETDGEFEEWFVDVAAIDHRRCALFTHKVTLYSFWVPGMRKADLGRFDKLFQQYLVAALTRDGFHTGEIERLVRAGGHRFAKTNDRSVIGSMKDHILCSRCYFEHEGGLARADIAAIDDRLNRTPMGALAAGQHMDLPLRVLERIIRTSGAA